MIDQRRCPAVERGQGTDLTTRLDAFARMGAIQSPPDELETLMKVARCLGWWGHAGRQGRIEMGMAIDQARHQDGTVTIDDFVVLGRNDFRTDGHNLTFFLPEVSDLCSERVELNQDRILKAGRHHSSSKTPVRSLNDWIC